MISEEQDSHCGNGASISVKFKNLPMCYEEVSWTATLERAEAMVIYPYSVLSWSSEADKLALISRLLPINSRFLICSDRKQETQRPGGSKLV